MTKKIGIYLAGSIKKGHENPQESFWTEKMLSDPSIEIKRLKHIQATMRYYQESQLPIDFPMREILNCETFNDRLTRPLAEVH